MDIKKQAGCEASVDCAMLAASQPGVTFGTSTGTTTNHHAAGQREMPCQMPVGVLHRELKLYTCRGGWDHEASIANLKTSWSSSLDWGWRTNGLMDG